MGINYIFDTVWRDKFFPCCWVGKTSEARRALCKLSRKREQYRRIVHNTLVETLCGLVLFSCSSMRSLICFKWNLTHSGWERELISPFMRSPLDCSTSEQPMSGLIPVPLLMLSPKSFVPTKPYVDLWSVPSECSPGWSVLSRSEAYGPLPDAFSVVTYAVPTQVRDHYQCIVVLCIIVCMHQLIRRFRDESSFAACWN